MATDLEHVRSIAQRVAESSGLELVEVELRGGGKHRMLRLVIDRAPGAGQPGSTGAGGVHGVTHEDCAAMSREVSAILDVEDAVPGGSYTLEVSSPGLDRKLERPADFERFTGSRVKLMTREPVAGNRHFEGRLEACSQGRLVLDLTIQNAKGKRKKTNLEGGGRREEGGGSREEGGGSAGESRQEGGTSSHPVAPKAGAQGWGTQRVEIELANVERANLVPEI